jgi:microcystin-dependent protein
MASIAPFGRYRAFDSNGAPLAGGKLYTYEAGTSTPKVTYTTKDQSAANTNPIILDADGYADVWLDVGGYKFVLDDANDNTLWTQDDIDGGSATGYASAVVSRSSSFALSTNEQNYVIVATASITVSLLPAATAGDGFAAIIVNQSGGSVTIDPDGSETINGAGTLVLADGESTSIHTDGSDWFSTSGYVADGSVTTDKLAFGITGMVVPYAGSAAPTGWLLCYGQAVSRTTYLDLFNTIGDTYGAGDGSTTFNLPDLRGRSVFGVDNMGGSAANRVTSGVSGITATTLGASGGDENMQQHNHTLTDPGHSHGMVQRTGFGSGGTAVVSSSGTASTNYNTNGATTGISIAQAGSGSSENMPPAIVLNYVIKT